MLRWMQTRHMLADMLTKKVAPTPTVVKFLKQNICSAVPSREAELDEKIRLELPCAQRQRRRDRKHEEKAAASTTKAAMPTG